MDQSPRDVISKTQIDRLGERLKKGSLNESDLRTLDDYRKSFGSAYKEVVREIHEQLKLDPTGRPAKSTSSIIEKLKRESIRLSQMQDISGCRIVVNNVLEQDKVVVSLQRIFSITSIVDRRIRPSFGYRAVHVIVEIMEKSVEVQVRTELQHAWAELSEKFSDQIDPAIKYGGGDEAIQTKLFVSSQVLELSELLIRKYGKDQFDFERKLIEIFNKAAMKIPDEKRKRKL